MSHLEANGFIMMISYGLFQERNIRLTYNVEYDLWEAYIYVLVCYQHTILSLTTWNRNYFLALNIAIQVIQCQDDNRVCI